MSHLCLVADTLAPSKKLSWQIDPTRFAKIREARMNIHAVGEPPHGAPVAHPARENVEQLCGLRRSAELLDDAVYGHTDRTYSRRLKKSSGLKTELIQKSASGKLKAMKAAPKSRRAPPSPRSVPAIAQRLYLTRLALGLSQTELCRTTGVATNTYNQWEKGKGRPELDKALLLCDAFHLTLDWIYRGDHSGLRHDLVMRLIDESDTEPAQALQ